MDSAVQRQPVLFDEIEGLAIGPFVLRKPRNVSTVYLGLNHRWGDGPPLIFETMTFPDEEQWRYSTEAEAKENHAFLVKFYRFWWWSAVPLQIYWRARRRLLRLLRRRP